MTWTPILAFAVIAIILGIGDLVASKTKGYISSILVAIILLLIFGGTLQWLPADLMERSGVMSMIPTFGMALILVNVGSMMNLNELRNEWKTVLVSLIGIGGLILLDITVGMALFGKEQALVAIAPTAGGMVATMMLTESANTVGRADLASFVVAVFGLQQLVGVPISSICLRKAADQFLSGDIRKDHSGARREINFRLLPKTPPEFDIDSFHFARLAIVGTLALLCTQVTGISTGVTFLVFGIIFGAIGFVEKGALRSAGGEGLLMLATYASILGGFVSMNLAQFGKMLIPVMGLLIIAAVGIIIFSVIVAKIVHWSPWIAIPVGLACMYGYPVTYALAMEAKAGATKGKDYSPETVQALEDYLLPKMLIAGVVSVSIVSVLLAGFIGPMVFGS